MPWALSYLLLILLGIASIGVTPFQATQSETFEESSLVAGIHHQDEEVAESKDDESSKSLDQPPTQDELSEMELMEKVAALQLQLEAVQIGDRDAAEKDLEKLGYRILDFLEPMDKASTDARERMQRVRQKLEKLAVAAVTKPSFVTLKGAMSISKAIVAINRQTGNKVQIPDGVPDELTGRVIQLSLANVNFWTAINSICEKANLAVDAYGSMPGVLTLVPVRAPVDQDGNPINIQPDPLPSDQKSIFNFEVMRVDSSRNLANPALSHCRLQLRVRWEPRVKPISINIPMKQLEVVDEFDSKLEIRNIEGVLSGIVQQEIPELEFSIPLPLIDRQVEELRSLSATINTVLPGRIETFKFKNVAQLQEGAQQRKGGAIVTYGGTRKNDDVYGVTITLSFDETSRAFESHQGWVFQNEMYLTDKDGNRLENVGQETVMQTDTEVGIHYYFVENPLEHTIVYKTPAAIVQLPVSIKLTNIPLP